MANNFRGNDALGKMNFLGNVIRDIAIRGTVIRANDFRGTDPYPPPYYDTEKLKSMIAEADFIKMFFFQEVNYISFSSYLKKLELSGFRKTITDLFSFLKLTSLFI
jgi:hypothetical protein